MIDGDSTVVHKVDSADCAVCRDSTRWKAQWDRIINVVPNANAGAGAGKNSTSTTVAPYSMVEQGWGEESGAWE